ncbi:hypothetical protein PO124_09205 [Bacillus licheniformis]|nr:hypothetical protein [Bacillus licheniformis]
MRKKKTANILNGRKGRKDFPEQESHQRRKLPDWLRESDDADSKPLETEQAGPATREGFDQQKQKLLEEVKTENHSAL